MNKFLLIFFALLIGVYAPIVAQSDKSQVPLADPYILLEDGTYYAYGTYDADGIRCYSSTDLKYWRYRGLALSKSNTTENRWFWAPEVYHVGNRYIMYYSANEHLYAATSLKPTGPFRQVGSYQMGTLLG
ncbi:MAG: family 43 glycosylhydrolase, partial [Bacteroidaceae bacterium]